MYSCPINNNATYNFAGSVNGSNPIPAFSNVPSLYAFCFENGNARSVVLINTDLTASHTISFAGTNTPAGAVTQRQFAPASLDDLNEAHTGTASNQTAATVAIETSSLSSPSSITLPPHSVTALDYITGGQAAAAEPTFTPAGGTYASAQTVTLSDATSGATIYYTTNGTTPTTSSAVYSGPITVSATETLEVIAAETGYSNSPVATAVYTIKSTLPAPAFSPAGGTYTASQTVSISDATAGTTIYYTTNGSTPTTSSAVYSGPITVSATETLNAIAAETGYSNSPVATAVYTIKSTLPAPAFSPAGGTYTASQTVSIGDATAGTTIYYTTNGSTPTTSSAVYSGPITVSATETLNAIAAETGYSNSPVATAVYTIKSTLPAPAFSPAGGTYTASQTVSIGDATAGTTIYYTTNGSTPTTSSAVYSGPITVSATETLNAIAAETGYSNSPVATAVYTINTNMPAPTITPAGGTYTTAQSVIIGEAMSGSSIHYTTDGTTPTTSSPAYNGPVNVNSSVTVKAIAAMTGYTNSPPASAVYTIKSTLPAPVFSPAGGTYTAPQTVSISDATAGTTIYYTTNGSTPTTSSAVYSGPITVSATETLQAIATASSYTTSAAASAAYTISSTTKTTPVVSIASNLNPSAFGSSVTFTAVLTGSGTKPTGSVTFLDGTTTLGTGKLNSGSAKFTTSSLGGGSHSITASYGGNSSYNTAKSSVLIQTVNPTTPTVALTSSLNPSTVGASVTFTATLSGSGALPAAAVTFLDGTTTLGTVTPSGGVATFTTTALASGSHSILASFVGGTNYYPAKSSVVTQTVNAVNSTSYINYSSNGFTSSNLSMNNGPSVVGGVLQVTDGGAGEDRSAWFKTKVPVTSFITDFTFQILNGAADGFTFTIQNAPKGIWALGNGGGGLGYQGIQNSVALKFDIYNDAGEGKDSTGVYIDGAAPTLPATDLSSTGITLTSGDLIHAHLVYSGSTLAVTLTDTKTGATVTNQFTVNIPTVVGSSTAYVGFTGGTGSYSATQQVTSWTYLTK
jgi:hypothetical protein